MRGDPREHLPDVPYRKERRVASPRHRPPLWSNSTEPVLRPQFVGSATKKVTSHVFFFLIPMLGWLRVFFLSLCLGWWHGQATYTTETQEWARWLKMGLSAAKLGKSVLSAAARLCSGGVGWGAQGGGPEASTGKRLHAPKTT